MMHRLVVSSIALLLGACSGGIVGGSGEGRVRPVQSAPPPPANPPAAFKAPRVQNESGLESVLGQRAGALTRRFGEARIDLKEGDARKLQFVGTGCVLDIYLYPREAGAEAVATHIEARLRKGGAKTDRAGCIREVEGSRR